MSNHNDDYYDPDEVGNETPPLKPVHPNYRFVETPPPFVSEETPSSSCSPESVREGGGRTSRPGRGKRRKGRRQAPAIADAVLISSLDPNQPDVARVAELDPLEVDSEEGEDSEDEHMSKTDEEGHEANHVNAKEAAAAADVAREALAAAVDDDDDDDDDEDSKMREAPEVPIVKENGTQEPPVTNGVLQNGHSPAKQEPLEPKLQPEKKFDVRPPPRLPPSLPPIRTDSSKSSSSRIHDREDSLATSPNLAKFTISEAEGNPDSTLPAMQMSPPRSSSGHSPESQQTLPSLQTALSMESAGGGGGKFSLPGHSPTMTRPSPAHISQFGPSPSSYSQPSPNMSPPCLPTHAAYWRSQEGSMSTPSEYYPTPTSNTAMTPSSTTSYTSSIATVAEHNLNHHHRQDSLDESTSASSPQSQGQLLNGPVQPNGALATNSFKCTFHGCTASPFQTQYLLNSHANVHSSSRPHFCPVPECPRGPGGKGFKRKNEMIRHGLVHDSPGYVCPFCPDQQHKYPRPDNLQRHVRVHHTDKNRDDPMLRHVLAQRPEGGNRGRRRRGGSTG